MSSWGKRIDAGQYWADLQLNIAIDLLILAPPCQLDGGSFCRVAVTPWTMASPTRQITPTTIHLGGMWSKCAPMARPTISMMYPTM
jgi:hypothetical protein